MFVMDGLLTNLSHCIIFFAHMVRLVELIEEGMPLHHVNDKFCGLNILQNLFCIIVLVL